MTVTELRRLSAVDYKLNAKIKTWAVRGRYVDSHSKPLKNYSDEVLQAIIDGYFRPRTETKLVKTKLWMPIEDWLAERAKQLARKKKKK